MISNMSYRIYPDWQVGVFFCPFVPGAGFDNDRTVAPQLLVRNRYFCFRICW